jgi:hypothetical protein
MWQVYVFNLGVALLIAGWYLRAVRRLERRMDERMKRFDEWASAQEAKTISAYAEMKAAMREKVDLMIAESQVALERSQDELRAMEALFTDPLPVPDTDTPTGPPTQTVPH